MTAKHDALEHLRILRRALEKPHREDEERAAATARWLASEHARLEQVLAREKASAAEREQAMRELEARRDDRERRDQRDREASAALVLPEATCAYLLTALERLETDETCTPNEAFGWVDRGGHPVELDHVAIARVALPLHLMKAGWARIEAEVARAGFTSRDGEVLTARQIARSLKIGGHEIVAELSADVGAGVDRLIEKEVADEQKARLDDAMAPLRTKPRG